MSRLEKKDRPAAFKHWLEHDCALNFNSLSPLHGDASFRRYYRIQQATRSLIVMDAPPPQENCRPFIAVAQSLHKLGLRVPEIIVADVEQGFLLLTDFGDMTYLKALRSHHPDHLYQTALRALHILRECKSVPDWPIPHFTAALMWQEWENCKEWFFGKLLHLPAEAKLQDLDTCYQQLVDSALSQPQVFMHRDYHANNLMFLPENEVGILDFQDAFFGPITYDLVSLLRDCYIDWPQEKIVHWVNFYFHLNNEVLIPDMKLHEFLHLFDRMGVQRHLKALFTFARKYVRDGQSHYLQYIPRTLNYLCQVTQHDCALSALYHYLQHVVQPAFIHQRQQRCAH